MKLSAEVKDFLKFINNAEECTIHDLITRFCTVNELIINNPFSTGTGQIFTIGDKVFSIKDHYQFFKMIKTLKFICDRPDLLRLISVFKSEIKVITKVWYFTMEGSQVVLDHTIINEVLPYEKTTYSSTAELSDFINNNFLTDEEVKANNEMQRDIANGKLTRRMAYLSLLVTILISIGTAIFNYMTYSNIRNVNISSMPKSEEPIKIMLVDENGKTIKQIEFSKDDTVIIKK